MDKTIDDVLTELEAIITNSERNNDRAGYFAALYYLVTKHVKEGIANGDFEDGKRMAELDVQFASRYLDAYHRYRKNEPVTDSWKIAFDTTKKRSRLVMQQLLMGINAHINLDLGIAAAQVMKDKRFQDIRKDFIAINTIISLLTGEVLNDIAQVSPLLSLLGLHATNNAAILVQFSVGNARDGAWTFGEELAEKTGNALEDCIKERDKTIALFGKALVQSKGFLKFTVWLVHLFEWKNPARVIKVLREYKKADIKKTELKKYA